MTTWEIVTKLTAFTVINALKYILIRPLRQLTYVWDFILSFESTKQTEMGHPVNHFASLNYDDPERTNERTNDRTSERTRL